MAAAPAGFVTRRGFRLGMRKGTHVRLLVRCAAGGGCCLEREQQEAAPSPRAAEGAACGDSWGGADADMHPQRQQQQGAHAPDASCTTWYQARAVLRGLHTPLPGP